MAEYIKKETVLDYFREKERIADEAAQNGEATVFDAVFGGIAQGCIEDLSKIPAADVVPWEFLERYADWFCAKVEYPEFIREAKAFYLDTYHAMDGGNIE